MIALSVLDLVPVREGGTAAAALADTAALAVSAEAAGYRRFWVAEHHGMDGVAGGATSVVLGHIGSATRTIRIGAGGIMLPNHNPFVIAEQFGTLDALYPGRIDLGLGRAPGADMRIAQALRKDLGRASEYFPQDVVELRAQFSADPALPLRATPGFGAPVAMFVFVHAGLREFSVLDAGIWLQTLILSAQSHGLATCAQGALAIWGGPLRAEFEVPAHYKLVCGVSIGFASTHAVNGFNPGRRDVQETFLLPKPGR